MITFILPVGDEAAARRTVQSLIAQSERRWNALVIGPEERAQGVFGDPRVRTVRDDSGRRSTVLTHAIGSTDAPILVFANEGTSYGPQFVQAATRRIVEGNAAWFCGSTPPEVLGGYTPSHRKSALRPLITELLRNPWLALECVAVSRRAVVALDGFVNQYERGFEYDFLLRLARVAPAALADNPSEGAEPPSLLSPERRMSSELENFLVLTRFYNVFPFGQATAAITAVNPDTAALMQMIQAAIFVALDPNALGSLANKFGKQLLGRLIEWLESYASPQLRDHLTSVIEEILVRAHSGSLEPGCRSLFEMVKEKRFSAYRYAVQDPVSEAMRATEPIAQKFSMPVSKVRHELERILHEERGENPVSPRVSIVLPFHRLDALLLRAVNGVLRQTFTDWELILVDDGAKGDPSSLMSLTSKDARIKVIRQSNQGAGAARNAGIEVARSKEYIAFCDSDDEWFPSKLERQILLMDRHPSVVLSHTSYLRVAAGSEKVIECRSGRQSGNLAAEFLTFCEVATPTVVIRRSALRGNLFGNGAVGEDVLAWCKLSSRGLVLGIDECLCRVNVDESSAAFSIRNTVTSQLNLMLGDHEYALPSSQLSQMVEKLRADVDIVGSPRVSIVVPVFNGADYIETTLLSIADQHYKNVEIIVVNDGSTDGGATRDKVQSLNLRNLRYLEKTNGGVSSALNAGLEAMTGEYFAWLSHDDLIAPYKIQKQIDFLRATPQARIVGCSHTTIDAKGKIVATNQVSAGTVLRNGRDTFGFWIFGGSLLIHRECFGDHLRFNEENRYVQDYEMWHSLLARHNFFYIPEVLASWRDHNQGAARDAVDSRQKENQDRGRRILFEMLLGKFDISWFFPSGVDPKLLSERDLARVTIQTYLDLAHQAFVNHESRSSGVLCLQALREYVESIDRGTVLDYWPYPFEPGL